MKTTKNKNISEATTNACRLCTPLGASLVFKGVRGAIPLMHGSQGCSTYIRRYLISHYKEPIDIASSNFSEDTAIFGGAANLKLSIANVTSQYEPELIGISTTCLSETIGDDVPSIIQSYKAENKENRLPHIVHVSTPSYSGTHADGFTAAVRALVNDLAENNKKTESAHINMMPGMLSPADLRHLKEILCDFHIRFTMLPDYSLTMDSGPWKSYQRIPEGGAGVEDISKMGSAKASIEFGSITHYGKTAADLLKEKFSIPAYRLPMPLGMTNTDIFFETLKQVSGKPVPDKYRQERQRLLDSYIDAHKYVFGAKAVLYGEEDFVAGMFTFLSEIGVHPVLCASGGTSGKLKTVINKLSPENPSYETEVLEGVDFDQIEEAATDIRPDFFIGHSKGYSVTRKLKVPLIRSGFPIHDRIGGSRLLHVGYKGAQELFDKLTNAILESKQEESNVGYSYL